MERNADMVDIRFRRKITKLNTSPRGYYQSVPTRFDDNDVNAIVCLLMHQLVCWVSRRGGFGNSQMLMLTPGCICYLMSQCDLLSGNWQIIWQLLYFVGHQIVDKYMTFCLAIFLSWISDLLGINHGRYIDYVWAETLSILSKNRRTGEQL